MAEVKNLHHLLDGYISILYRLNQESIEGRKFDNWIYDAQSKNGRPDRPRSKLTSEEALTQLHNLDAIFPLYEKYFNASTPEDATSILGIIGERVQNVEVTLAKLEENAGSKGHKHSIQMGVLFAILISLLL